MIFQQKPKILQSFQTKTGKVVEIRSVSLKDAKAVQLFNNRLVEEDTYLNLTGTFRTLEQEKRWLKNREDQDKRGDSFSFWAFCGGKIIGNAGMIKNKIRSPHVAEMAIMVDRDYRRDGVGQFLLEKVIEEAKFRKYKMVILDVFSDNEPAVKLYEKNGFVVYGRLPNGLIRKDKYSDEIKMYKVLND